ncbi:sugar phosphate isomerase/epimerase family protein [Nocardiopsis ansamitocini]|uniref:Inosose dehydratase n=1 Tax=Nocardiopsis ansamitocini TaxID=1670832 RepID=A0A9W6UIA3_9ACTN|nr:sugar phosphate isomerase/epimerase [Nocardiopsis ansamitocini]GLU47492.1 inosose dehydratase [Nocardiopsis ansamitocini]
MTPTPEQPRIAGAPISWGVCEVPGWGYQLAPDAVLPQMREAGLSATEFGPDGFLPAAPGDKAAALAGHGLAAVGGFVPVVLHEAAHDPLPDVDRAIDGFLAAGADSLVLAAATGTDGYDARPRLDADQWTVLLANLDRLREHAAQRAVTASLHPHVGTLVETAEEVDRVLQGSEMPLCLDTGHLLVGGADPRTFTRAAAGRIAHTHLKDVDGVLAEQVVCGALAYSEAVATGLYRPLGHGDVDLAGILDDLVKAGYSGWYVLEQDVMLAAAPEGEGPLADVRVGVAFIRDRLG